ncbi:hypothetical protein A2U01_0067765, partial [Trifolium medium]|nr:hypothetical protein [Trifolium medium]
MLQAPNCTLKPHKNKLCTALLARLRLARTGENKAGENLHLAKLGDVWRASRYLSPKLARRQLKNRQSRQISQERCPAKSTQNRVFLGGLSSNPPKN